MIEKLNAEQNVQAGWDFIFNRLFCKKTKIIYDYVTTEDENGAIEHLPTKEEIKKNYPNPCGWGTGMEDSDISGGIMLDAVITRYETTKDAEMKTYADDLYEGLMANATVSAEKGFLVRARLPEDGVTHYVNSSRDQYTHWIYAMMRFYYSELSDADQKESIKTVLVNMAEKAERDVTEKNNFCLLNEEGRPALVCEMCNENVVWHESLRIEMFFIAAYVVTKDKRWLKSYKKWRDWGLDYAEEIELTETRYPYAFALLQMQLSVKMLFEYETEKTYKKRYGKLMEKVAVWSERFVKESKKELKDFVMPKTIVSWRDCPEEFTSDSVQFGYRVIMNHIYEATQKGRHRYLRNAGESIIIQLLCPNRKIKKQQVSDFLNILESVSFRSPYSYEPVSYCLAWWMLRKENSI